MTTHASEEGLEVLLRQLKLPSFTAAYDPLAQKAEREDWSCKQYLRHLVELEVEERRMRDTRNARRRMGSLPLAPRGSLQAPHAARRMTMLLST